MTTTALPSVDEVRAFLSRYCDDERELEALGIRHFTARRGGLRTLLFESRAPDGRVVRVAAAATDAEEGRALEARLNERHGPQGRFAQAAMYAPELGGLLFQVFPADRGLESLPEAMDAAAMTPVLEAVLGGRIADLEVEAVRYKPERKCVLRYAIRWDGDGPGVVWGRMSRPKLFARTRGLLRRLHAAGGDLGVDLPAPLVEVPDFGLELFSDLPGVPLFELVGRPDYPALCARSGAALRRLHALPVAVQETFDADAVLARLTAAAAEFPRLLPEQAGRIDALAGEIVEWLTASPPSPLRFIHGDFHGDNLLVDGDRIGLIDFEDCAMGEPAEDFALNWAQLSWHAAGPGVRRTFAEAGREAFSAAYLDGLDRATAWRLPVYSAMHCFLGAYQSVRRPRDAAPAEDAEIMLRACEEVIERA